MSLHEKWFERRWYGFRPRTPRVAIIGACAFAACVALLFTGIALLNDGEAWGWVLIAPVALLLLAYNTLGLSHSDW